MSWLFLYQKVPKSNLENTYNEYSGGHFFGHICSFISKLESFSTLAPIVKKSLSFEIIASSTVTVGIDLWFCEWEYWARYHPNPLHILMNNPTLMKWTSHIIWVVWYDPYNMGHIICNLYHTYCINKLYDITLLHFSKTSHFVPNWIYDDPSVSLKTNPKFWKGGKTPKRLPKPTLFLSIPTYASF